MKFALMAVGAGMLQAGAALALLLLLSRLVAR